MPRVSPSRHGQTGGSSVDYMPFVVKVNSAGVFLLCVNNH